MTNNASSNTYSKPTGGPTSVALKRPAAKQAVRPKWASTRPFEKLAPAQSTPDSDAQAEPSTPPAEWAQSLPSSQPRSVLRVVSVLQEGHHLPTRTVHDATLELTVWSDCSGMIPVMFALRELAIQLRASVRVIVKWVLDCTCDMDKMSRRFSELNHDPRHVGNQMQHRNFEAGQYYC